MTSNNSTNLYIQDFNGPAPGIYKIIHGFDSSILQQACVMQTLTDMLHELNKLITNFSNRMKNDDIVSAKTFFVYSILSTLTTVATIAIAGSFVFYSEPIEMAEPTLLQKLHQFLPGLKKAALSMDATLNVMKASFNIKKGNVTSDSKKIQSSYSQIESLVDTFGKTMDSCSQAISAETKAIKTSLQNDYAGKAKGLYFYKL